MIHPISRSSRVLGLDSMEKNQALEVSNLDGKIPISQPLTQTGVSMNQMSTISKLVYRLVFSWRAWENSGNQVQKYTRHSWANLVSFSTSANNTATICLQSIFGETATR